MRLDHFLHFLAAWMLADALEPFIGIEPAAYLTFVVVLAKEILWDWHLEKGTPDVTDVVASVPGIAIAGFWWSEWLLVLSWIFWALYVFTMGLYRSFLAGRLRGLPLLLASPFVIVAFVLDFLFQVTVFTVVFWDRPRHWLVTHRLRAYMRGRNTWRRRLADYLCKHLLDPFDPTGAHCDSDEPALKA